MTEEKLIAQLPVKCRPDFKTALDRIARANGLEGGAALLRRAGDAIIAFAALYGDKNVPLDMALVQAHKPKNELAMAAEDPANLYQARSSGRDDTLLKETKAVAVRTAQNSPSPPPALPDPPESLRPATGKRAKK